MTENVSWALQQSIHSALSASPEIVSRLGDGTLYDDIPRSARYPCLGIGQSVVTDYSIGSEGGNEHLITLHVWSRENGRQETFGIMDEVRHVLHDRVLDVSGHHLVNLRCEFTSVRRDPASSSCHGIMRYRAVTE